MQITLPAHPAAPLITGHPLGLPASPSAPDPRRVASASESADSDNAPERRAAATKSEELEVVLENPSDHVAPPTIMQLRIAALLEGGDTGPNAPTARAAADSYGQTPRPD